MASVAQIEDALRNADAAGDTEAARRLADALVAERQREDTQFLRDQGLSEGEIETQAAIRQRKPGQGVIPRQAAPGIGPRQPKGFTPDPSVAAIEAEADKRPRTMGGLAARDIPRTARGMAQGATFGFSDEALAGVRSLAGENYSEALEDERAELDKLGGARIPAEIVGALPLGFLAGGKVAAGKTLAGRSGRGALTGLGFAAPYGFGAGEGGLAPRLENAAITGVTGAAIGGGLPPALALAGTVARSVGRLAGPGASQNANKGRAAQIVARSIQEQFPDLSPEQALKRAERIVARYGDDAAILDVGRRTQQLAGDTARPGGAAGTTIDDFLLHRQQGRMVPSGQLRRGQYDRLTSALDEAAGGTKSGLKAQRSLKAQQRGASKPLYEQTANNPGNLVPDEQFRDLADDPYVAEQIAKVKKDKLARVTVDGRKVPLADLPDNSLPVIDATQKRMSDAANKAFRKGANNRGGEIADARQRLVQAADDAFPDYARARSVWRDFKGVQDADDLGRKFMRGDVDVLEDAVSRMTPEELDQFRAGAVAALKDKAAKTKPGWNAADRLIGTHDLRERTRLAFGDANTFRRYLTKAVGESKKFEAFAEAFRGSQTAERQARLQRMGIDPAELAEELAGAGFDAKTGNLFGLAMRGVRAARRPGLMGPPERVRREIANLVTGRDFDALRQGMGTARLNTANRRALERALVGGGLPETTRRARR